MVSVENNVSSEQERPQTWSTDFPTLVSQVPQRPGISHLLLFTSLFVPLVFLPYVPLRRHMLQQARQMEALKTQLGSQLAVTKETSRKLTSAIHENHRLAREIQGLRVTLQRVNGGIEGIRLENKEREQRDLAQSQWNKDVLGAIERMQKDTRP